LSVRTISRVSPFYDGEFYGGDIPNEAALRLLSRLGLPEWATIGVSGFLGTRIANISKENMYRLKSIFIALVAACLALASSFALGSDESPQPSENVSVQHDTAGPWSDGRLEAPFDITEDVRRAQELVLDPKKAALDVADYRSAISWASQTALRDVIGKTMLSDMLEGREKISSELQKIIDVRTEPWGINVI